MAIATTTEVIDEQFQANNVPMKKSNIKSRLMKIVRRYELKKINIKRRKGPAHMAAFMEKMGGEMFHNPRSSKNQIEAVYVKIEEIEEESGREED